MQNTEVVSDHVVNRGAPNHAKPVSRGRFSISLAVAAQADDAIPAATLATIKAATVFVKVEVEGMSGSGSGFVIKTDGNSAYIVTNHHVVEPKSVQVVMVRDAVPPRRIGRPGQAFPAGSFSACAFRQATRPTYTPRLMLHWLKTPPSPSSSTAARSRRNRPAAKSWRSIPNRTWRSSKSAASRICPSRSITSTNPP